MHGLKDNSFLFLSLIGMGHLARVFREKLMCNQLIKCRLELTNRDLIFG